MAFTPRVTSLDADKAAAFINHPLKIAQANKNIFEKEAMGILAADTGGNQRDLMNRCAMAVEVAAEQKEKIITTDLVNNLEIEF